jgi:hypothetical protein
MYLPNGRQFDYDGCRCGKRGFERGCIWMSANFLSNFMRVALQTTGAERGLAVDTRLSIIDMYEIDQAEILSDDFQGLQILRHALDTGQPVITNNAVVDPALAPVTNTNFSNLRVIVVIPVIGHGGVYLDQSIRLGIIPKETVERLMGLANHAIQHDQMNSTEAQLSDLYQRMG